MKKSVAGAGLGLALFGAATGSAFAHTPGAANVENSHGYLNAETCTGAPGQAAAGPSQTTDLGYPDPNTGNNPYGAFAADCRAVSSQSTAVLDATVHMLASLSLDDVINDTADVVDPGVSGVNSGDSITAFDFPTQTPNGGVNSDTMHVEVTTNTDWELSAAITGDFTQVTGGGGEVKAADTFSVIAEDDGDATTTEVGGGFGPALNTPVVVQTDIDNALDFSGPFHFRSGAAPGTEAGDYEGEITLTVTAI